MAVVHFATESYPSKSAPVDAQRVINMYAERQPPDAKTPVALFGSPGLSEFGLVGEGPIRGAHVMESVLYVVSGIELYSVDSAGNGTLLGTGVSGSSNVVMDDNNSQLVIVNGFGGWLYGLPTPGVGAAAQVVLGGDTQTTIATNLTSLVLANSPITTAGVLAFSSGVNLYLFSPTGIGATWSSTNGTTDTLMMSACSVETLTVGGTVASGNTLIVTATSASITDSPVSAEYITNSNDTTATIASTFATMISENGDLAAANIVAFSSGSVVYIFYPSTLTVSWSVSVTGSETLTLGTGTAAKGVVGGHTSSGDSLVLTVTSGSITGSPVHLTYNISTDGTIASVIPTSFGNLYTGAPPYVVITDPTGSFAAVTAVVSNGGVTSYVVNEPGQDYSNPQVSLVSGGFFPIENINFVTGKLPSSVTFFDDYFVFNRQGTNQWFISFLNDGTQYNSLDSAVAEVHPGNIQYILNDHELLYIFCQRHIEVWYDAGAADFPFQRYDGATIERGLLAPLSVVQQDQAIFFLGDDKIYYRLQAPLPIRVSTHGVEEAWSKYSTLVDAVCFTYVWEGHRFITINFPTANASWVLDVTSGLWHERVSYDSNAQSLLRWRGNCTPQFQVYDKVLVGDAFGGLIGYLNDLDYTEYSNPIIGQAVSTPIHSDRKRLFMNTFELDMETGVGLTSGQGSDPQIMLDWSDDGGRIFKGLQLWRSIGKIGEYLTRVRWLRMGSFRQRILRITISDPVRRTIISAHTQTEEGTN